MYDWDDKTLKVSVETNIEPEKGSNKLILTLPNSEPKTYSSNWYFNYNDFKTKGNTIFVIGDYCLSALKLVICNYTILNE